MQSLNTNVLYLTVSSASYLGVPFSGLLPSNIIQMKCPLWPLNTKACLAAVFGPGQSLNPLSLFFLAHKQEELFIVTPEAGEPLINSRKKTGLPSKGWGPDSLCSFLVTH